MPNILLQREVPEEVAESLAAVSELMDETLKAFEKAEDRLT
ncbi:MAG: hypothetical protein WA970_18340 [Gammaproteobacteria bacterium]